MKYQAILFDLDGTLIDTAPGIIACAKQTMKDLSIPLPPDNIFHRFIGPPLRQCFHVVAGCDEETCKKAADHYLNLFGPEHIEKFKIYPGILSLLDKLRQDGVKLAVATYKQKKGTFDSLNHFDLLPFFDSVCTSNIEGSLSKGDIIAQALLELGVDAKDALMIGDSPTDFIGADENGCDFLAAAYGYGFRETGELPGKYAAVSPTDILDILKD